MGKIIAILLAATFFCWQWTPLVAAGGYITHDSRELELLKVHGNSVYYPDKDSIIQQAQAILSKPAPSVADKKTVLAPTGDAHDYVSLSIYYWPDLKKLNGLPYIHKDGIINPEKEDTTRYDARRLDTLVYYLNTLALAYYLTGDETFAEKGLDVLNSWFVNPATRMNPNLNFCQLIPGKNQGTYWGIIETVTFIGLTDSIRMLEPSPHFSLVQQAAVKDWFREYLHWLLTSQFGIKEGQTTNNHAVWYDAQVAVYAHFVGRDDLAGEILAEVPEKRIAVQIEPDGKMPRELSRTRARHYAAYTLQAFITLARLGDELGINLYDYNTSDGRSIKKAIDWFIPYALAERASPYQEITPFKPSGFARYLHLANLHYAVAEYDSAIEKALHKAR